MKKLLLIALLIVGCDNSTEPKTTEWICTTDYQFESDMLEECEGIDCPKIVHIPEGVDENTIYNSLDECESVCPDSLQITTVSSPDGTGEYFTMYCKNNN